MKLDKKEQPDWLDPRGLHNAYGFSTSRQATLRSEGKIPFHKVGRYIRYKREDIDAWLDSHKMV